MVCKNFRLQCIVRVLVLGATITLFSHLLVGTPWYATTLIVGSIALYQVYALIHYVEKTNRDLTRFLQSIRHSDFSQTFTGGGLGASFDALNAAFSEVTDAFRRTRAEKEEQVRYLQTVVQHVGIGLISFGSDGEVALMNTAARRLLNAPQLKNITSLETFSKPLVDTLFRMKPGERALVKIEDHNESLQLAIYATAFRLRDQKRTLVSIQNIRTELEEKEMEAWQNLIRVLTHEIMNSVTPIASLTATVKDLFTASFVGQEPDEKIPAERIEDIRGALGTIQKRSEGLLHFVEAYRNLTRIPRPRFRIFPVAELFERVGQLMQAQMADRAIRFRTSVDPESLELTADPELIEQVLINLLLNAIQATQGRTDIQIELTARMDGRGNLLIRVADNGPGIIEEALDKIYIPFFTTRRDGSGIGLSISRQIMRLHRGTIGVRSEPDVETVFTLKF
ncbi:MAG: ATP-binding protein [Candidatus Latescibacteria bacterium 4484_107]|nr:MAG: ATP-binding protein [Candidatus Latescibacteria bacterium 4484_107]